MFFWGVSILVFSVSPFFFKEEEDGDQTPRVWGNPTDSTTFSFLKKGKLLNE
jgi:hypothetical protein